MRKTILLFSLIFLVIGASSASAQQRFVANLSGLQTVPANGSPARGNCFLRLNEAETQINAACNFANLSGNFTAVHIHGNASAGSNAPVIFNFNLTGGTGGSFGANFNVTPAQVAALRSNLLYADVHTSIFPNGEIRGQFKITNGSYNDYDGDGRTDLSVYRPANNTFFTERSLNNSLQEQQIGQPGDSISLNADFDGDGLADYAAVRLSQTEGQITWKIFQSATNTLRTVVWGNPTLGDFLAASDYDGDGKVDIGVFRAGVWYIIESSTGNTRYEYWGQSGDVPVPSDFDKDGKSDLAVARNESGQRVWYVRRSSDGQLRATFWGLGSDGFFAGRTDFDGDGASDLLVIRNENGSRVFYVLRSSDNQLQTVQWGLTSDLVRIGDYDGDGKTDFAVSRNTNGQKIWFIRQSSNDQVRTAYWGLASDF